MLPRVDGGMIMMDHRPISMGMVVEGIQTSCSRRLAEIHDMFSIGEVACCRRRETYHGFVSHDLIYAHVSALFRHGRANPALL